MRFDAGQAVEDTDITHRRVLNYLLTARGVTPGEWDDGVRARLVGAWHVQEGELSPGGGKEDQESPPKGRHGKVKGEKRRLG